MIRLLSLLIGVSTLVACTNSADFKKGEIEIFSTLKDVISTEKKPQKFIDARKLVTREKIDASGLEILFVELESGKNGTSIKYPGRNMGEVWLGVDGATITLKNGFLIATRGLGDDLMSSAGAYPSLHLIAKTTTYIKTQTWLAADNKMLTKEFSCTVSVESKQRDILVFDKAFLVRRAVETCDDGTFKTENEYYFDVNGLVRRSNQYLSPTLGSLLIERLD